MTADTDTGISLGAFLEIGHKICADLNGMRRESSSPLGVFKPIVQTVQNLPASGAIATDLGMPVRGRMWMVRTLITLEQGHMFSGANATTATATGAAGASTTATLPFFTPTMTGFDVSVQPATAAGTAVITVTGAGKPTLTYYLAESTTAAATFSARFSGQGLVGYNAVNIAALGSGGIPTVNVYGVATGSPATSTWYVGSPDTSGTGLTAPPEPMYRWIQGLPTEGSLNTMPFIDRFSQREFPVTYPEHLINYLQNGIAGENFQLVVIVEEYDIPDMAQMRMSQP